MATNTTNYNFKKPDESDFYSVQDQNNNWIHRLLRIIPAVQPSQMRPQQLAILRAKENYQQQLVI